MSYFPNYGTYAIQSPGQGHLIKFKISELEKATKHFNPSHKIGEGEFGGIYKGTINICEKETYVLIQEFQGHGLKEKSDHAWVKELTNNVASIKHQNLVDLIGYCLSNGVRFVVGEFECYDSTSHLFSGYSMYFTWYKRLNVALDVARALAYLHEHQMVLRCFKSSSIVIDNKLEGKLFDHAIVRERPYSAPFFETEMQYGLSAGQFDQYFMSYKTPTFDNLTSTKDNVRSFGVVLLELITGQPAFNDKRSKNERKLEDWVRISLSRDVNNIDWIINPWNEGIYCKESVMELVELSSMCTEEDPGKRPNMRKVYNVLRKILGAYISHYNEIAERQRQRFRAYDDGIGELIICLVGGLFHLILGCH